MVELLIGDVDILNITALIVHPKQCHNEVEVWARVSVFNTPMMRDSTVPSYHCLITEHFTQPRLLPHLLSASNGERGRLYCMWAAAGRPCLNLCRYRSWTLTPLLYVSRICNSSRRKQVFFVVVSLLISRPRITGRIINATTSPKLSLLGIECS